MQGKMAKGSLIVGHRRMTLGFIPEVKGG